MTLVRDGLDITHDPLDDARVRSPPDQHRLRILVVSPYFPWPPTSGGAMRVYQLVRELARRNSVTLLTYRTSGPDLPPSELGDLCEEVRTVPRQDLAGLRRRLRQVRSLLSAQPFHGSELYSEQMQAAIDEVLIRKTFDIVQVEASPMMCFRFDTTARLVLNEHNIESEVLARQHQAERSAVRRFFNGREARKYRTLEDAAWARADACVLTSEREVPEVETRVPGVRTAVARNAVDAAYFQPQPQRELSEAGIVFTGLLSYRPNMDGARWFIDEVLPLIRRRVPAATLTVVGAGTPAELQRLAAAGVTVTGLVPDIRPYIAEARCVVAPIRMGGGTRLKVVEAMAMGKAMVSTSVGCEGIDVSAGTHLLVADDPASFADAVCDVLTDDVLARRLGVGARLAAVERYGWAQSADSMQRLYAALLAPGAGNA
jgi:sugar transferase (PEP-CTERM/EpsH1 system associated)